VTTKDELTEELKQHLVALGEDLATVAPAGIDAGLGADPKWVAAYEKAMVAAGSALIAPVEYGYHHGESPNSEAKEAWDAEAAPLVARALDAGKMAERLAEARNAEDL
jgi:hypothetical protein